MTQDRLWNFISAVGLVVVAAVWLWFLFAYAELIFRQQQPIPSLWPSIVVFACAAIVAAGALALIGWIALALLDY